MGPDRLLLLKMIIIIIKSTLTDFLQINSWPILGARFLVKDSALDYVKITLFRLVVMYCIIQYILQTEPKMAKQTMKVFNSKNGLP